ncbi:MAG TPA: ABC transporter permease, partial [Kribbella sp.]
MTLFILRRLGSAIPVVLGITVISFALVHLVPGDPAKVILYGSNASPEQIALLRQQLGLDQPIWRQYFDFADNLLHGNLGTSFLTQNSVAFELLSRAPSTLVLTAASMLVAMAVGIPLGLVAG